MYGNWDIGVVEHSTDNFALDISPLRTFNSLACVQMKEAADVTVENDKMKDRMKVQTDRMVFHLESAGNITSLVPM